MAQVSNETEAMVWKRPSFCGKGVTDEEWNILHEVIDSCGLSRHELASTICESLGWVRANGNLKSRGMLRVPRFARSEGIGGATPSCAKTRPS